MSTKQEYPSGFVLLFVQCGKTAGLSAASREEPASGCRLHTLQHPTPTPPTCTNTHHSSLGRHGFSHVLAAASSHGRNVLPRAAALLDVQAVADVSQVLDPSTFVRPIYAGNALTTARVLGEGPRLLTVRTTAFAAAPPNGGSAPVEAVGEEELAAARHAAGGSEWVGEDVRKSGECSESGAGGAAALLHPQARGGRVEGMTSAPDSSPEGAPA